MSATAPQPLQTLPEAGFPLQLSLDVPVMQFARALAEGGLTMVQGSNGVLTVIVDRTRPR